MREKTQGQSATRAWAASALATYWRIAAPLLEPVPGLLGLISGPTTGAVT